MSKHVDPSLPYVEITIGGLAYKMTYRFRDLALAEDDLRRRGHQVDLQQAMLVPSLSSTLSLFAASLMAYQPHLDYEEAKLLVDDDNYIEVLTTMQNAKKVSHPDPEKVDPPKPAGQPGKKSPGRSK
jgi:hypothetical protein